MYSQTSLIKVTNDFESEFEQKLYPKLGFQTAINKVPGTQIATTTDIADWMIHTLQYDEEMAEYAHQLVGISSRITWKQWIIRTYPGKLLLMTSTLGLLAYIYYFIMSV